MSRDYDLDVASSIQKWIKLIVLLRTAGMGALHLLPMSFAFSPPKLCSLASLFIHFLEFCGLCPLHFECFGCLWCCALWRGQSPLARHSGQRFCCYGLGELRYPLPPFPSEGNVLPTLPVFPLVASSYPHLAYGRLGICLRAPFHFHAHSTFTAPFCRTVGASSGMSPLRFPGGRVDRHMRLLPLPSLFSGGCSVCPWLAICPATLSCSYKRLAENHFSWFFFLLLMVVRWRVSLAVAYLFPGEFLTLNVSLTMYCSPHPTTTYFTAGRRKFSSCPTLGVGSHETVACVHSSS